MCVCVCLRRHSESAHIIWLSLMSGNGCCCRTWERELPRNVRFWYAIQMHRHSVLLTPALFCSFVYWICFVCMHPWYPCMGMRTCVRLCLCVHVCSQAHGFNGVHRLQSKWCNRILKWWNIDGNILFRDILHFVRHFFPLFIRSVSVWTKKNLLTIIKISTQSLTYLLWKMLYKWTM